MSVDEQLSSAFGQFGSIVSITVRTKSGTDKSWALVSARRSLIGSNQQLMQRC